MLPPQEEVVIVQNTLALLGLDIGAEQPFQLARPRCTPGKSVLQHLVERRLGVDRVGVDGETGALLREAAVGPAQGQLVAHEVDEVGGVAAIQDGEAGVEADRVGIVAQQACADAVEGAGPFQPAGEAAVAAERLSADPLGTANHRLGRASGEGQQQQPPGIGTLEHQMRDAMGERCGLAGAGAGDDQQGRPWRQRPRCRQAVQHCSALRRVELVEMGFGCHGTSDSGGADACEEDGAFASAACGD